MKKIKLFKSSKNKDLNYRNNELLNFIDLESQDKDYNSILKWLSNKIDIPEDILRKETKIFLHRNYIAGKGEFSSIFYLKNLFKSILRFFGFFVWIYIFRKPEKKIKTYEVEIIVDDVLDQIEAKNFITLKKYFSKVLFISKKNLSNEFDFISFNYKNLNRKILFSKNFNIFFQGFYLIFKNSIKCKINLFDIILHLIKQVYKCENLFTKIKSDYLIQLRPYGTSEIKRHIYHKHGGKYVSVIQKNPEQLMRQGGIAYADILFSLGLKTGENAVQSGGNYDKIVPVGSLVMESWYFNSNINDNKIPSYDLINLIANYSQFSDGSENYLACYYKHCDWLKRFSNEFPKLNVAIKRRPGDGIDKNKDFLNFFRNSKVKIITGSESFSDKKSYETFAKHSYHYANKAKVICTWQSTVGLELIGNGKPCIFMNPGGNNISVLPNNNIYNKIKVQTYEEFKKTYFEIVDGSSKMFSLNNEDYCLKSDKVSERISGYLKTGAV
tara:strand:- start:9577 stop:11067 length:1491 start_codon:yes stop_codon:yes gene_type:complete